MLGRLPLNWPPGTIGVPAAAFARESTEGIMGARLHDRVSNKYNITQRDAAHD
jgi:hypothetical protein